MDDITKIFPALPRELSITLTDGSTDTVQVREFTIGQLPRVLALGKSVYGHIQSLSSTPDNMGELIADLLAVGGDDLFEIIGLSINRKRAWFDSVPMDAAVDLFQLFLEANMTFFVQRVLPKFKTGMEQVRATMGGLTASLT